MLDTVYQPINRALPRFGENAKMSSYNSRQAATEGQASPALATSLYKLTCLLLIGVELRAYVKYLFRL